MEYRMEQVEKTYFGGITANVYKVFRGSEEIDEFVEKSEASKYVWFANGIRGLGNSHTSEGRWAKA